LLLLLLVLKKQGSNMIEQRFPLNFRHHHPIFLAVLLLSIAISAFCSQDQVQVVSREHLDIMGHHQTSLWNGKINGR